MEDIVEVIENMQSQIISEMEDVIEGNVENVMNSIMEDYLPEVVENAVMNVIQGLSDDETAKDRLYVLSQDKKLFAPITYAQVQNANNKLPKSAEFPFVIMARIGIFTNNIFGWYKDEESAKAELKNIFEALKFADKNEYAVYEMN